MNWLVILVLMWLIIFWLIVGFGWYFCGFMQMVIYVLAYMFITFGVFLLSLQGVENRFSKYIKSSKYFHTFYIF